MGKRKPQLYGSANSAHYPWALYIKDVMLITTPQSRVTVAFGAVREGAVFEYSGGVFVKLKLDGMHPNLAHLEPHTQRKNVGVAAIIKPCHGGADPGNLTWFHNDKEVTQI